MTYGGRQISKRPENVALHRNLKRSFFPPDLLVNQNGTADIGAELGKVNSVGRLPFKLSISASERQKKEGRCKTAGGRDRGKGREREREAGLRRHMGETAETEGRTD